MEDIYSKVIEFTKDMIKSWTTEDGKLSPFATSSSQHNETSDNHLEHYVKPSPTDSNATDIASMFNSNLFMNGGDRMTEKTFDVDSSITSKDQYINEGSSTTEPDPNSELAITKAVRPDGSSDVVGEATVGTTANTTTQAPNAGETTEPVAKSAHNCPSCGGDACPDCNKAMHLCNCSGMNKSDSVTENTTEIEKAAEADETQAEEAKETPAEEAKEEKEGKEESIKKSSSLWNGAFAPIKF